MTSISGLGQLDILKMLAAKGGNLGMVDHRGDSAIYWAARQGHEDIIRYLLSQGVHLNQQNKVIFLFISKSRDHTEFKWSNNILFLNTRSRSLIKLISTTRSVQFLIILLLL